MRDGEEVDAEPDRGPGAPGGAEQGAGEGRPEGQGRDKAEDADADQQPERELRGRPDEDQEPAGSRELPEDVLHGRLPRRVRSQRQHQPLRLQEQILKFFVTVIYVRKYNG